MDEDLQLTNAAERQMLEGWLDLHRGTLARKCAGLTAEQLRTRSVPPSTLSLLGLVRHMADVEQHWFQRMLRNDHVRPHYWTKDDDDADFNFAPDADPDEALAVWQAECQRSREIASGMDDLGTLAGRTLHGNELNLRWILVHMIEEYARHNGHADLLRECIDGQTGE